MTDASAKFVVDPRDDGRTVAAVLRDALEAPPWSKVRALCTAGRVRVDGERELDPARRVAAGTVIELDAPGGRVAAASEVTIHYVDTDVVVVDKPAGLLTVPFEPSDRDTLLHRVQIALRRRLGPGPALRVVSRLDKDTTGVVVFARSRRAERFLQAQFRSHSVERRYMGLALGHVQPATHRTFLVPNRGDGLRGSFHGGKLPPVARKAVTHVDVLRRYTVPATLRDGSLDTVTLVACRLETGRQHQIRIHLAESGHPLVGERVYIRDHRGGFVRGFTATEGRPMLHAAELGFVHPADETLRRFASPWPEDLQKLLEQLEEIPAAR